MGIPGLSYAPEDITPEKFFNEWLPEQFEPLKPMALKMVGDNTAGMSIKLDSGEWTCAISPEGLSVSEGLSDDSAVTLVMSDDNFSQAVTGKLKMNFGGPGGGNQPSLEEAPGMFKNAVDTVKQVNGALMYQLTGAGDGDFSVIVKFAGPMKDTPDVTVTIDKEDAEAMAKGEIDPQSAFMQGKVQISGDMTLLMQLMPLMAR